MSEIDLLNLARSCGQTISSDFAQVITIAFAMVVAIYYFLHQAGIRMKIFAFAPAEPRLLGALARHRLPAFLWKRPAEVAPPHA